MFAGHGHGEQNADILLFNFEEVAFCGRKKSLIMLNEIDHRGQMNMMKVLIVAAARSKVGGGI